MTKKPNKYSVPLRRALAKLAGAEAREVEMRAAKSEYTSWEIESSELTMNQHQTRGQACTTGVRIRPIALTKCND